MKVREIKGLFPFGYFNIEGTDSWLYQVDTTVDFYDNNMMVQIGERLPGSEIRFISYPEGKVYRPVEKTPGVYYDKPGYFNGRLFFIRVDFNEKTVALLKYFPEKEVCQELFVEKIENINLYNLGLGVAPLMLYSQGDTLEVYYPQRLSLKIEGNESFVGRVGDDFYFTAWVEEGLERSGAIGEAYEYYEQVVIKDIDSNVKAKERGSAFIMTNGDLWIAKE